VGDAGEELIVPFSRHPDGVLLQISDQEVETLRIVPELLATVGDVPGDPAAARLDVDAYADEPEEAEEFRRLMTSEMEAGRNADRSAFLEVLDGIGAEGVVMSSAEAEAWLTVLGEARLILAARLGIVDEGWGERDEDASNPSMILLHYLSWLQGELAELLLETL
jgi:hypothetical protein